MKGSARIRLEAEVEDEILGLMEGEGVIDGNYVFRSEQGDFLVEVRAHYLGSKSKRLREPSDGD